MSILQMSTQAGVLIIAIIAIRVIALHKLPKPTFLVLWAVSLVRLLVPFSISSQVSVYTLVDKAIDHASASQMLTPGAAPVQNNPLIVGMGTADTPAQAIGQQAVSTDPLLMAWIIGMVVAFLFFAVVFWRSCRELRFAWIVRDGAFIDEWLSGHRLLRSLSVWQSDRITTPITVGYLRPRIILPKAVDMKGKRLLGYILTHEYYHIRRFDAVWKLLITAALCIHWFNPLVWIMVVLVNRDLEITCDELVVRHYGADTKAAYAYSLIGMAEQKSKLAPLFSGYSKNSVEERITAIMKYKKTSVMAILLAVFLVTGMTAVFAANSDTIDAEAEAENFLAGDTVIAQISAGSVSNLWSYQFTLHYDDNAIKIKSIHPAIDEMGIFTKHQDGSLLVGAVTTAESSDGFTGRNVPVCEFEMEVLQDGPVAELSIQDVQVVDTAMNLLEDISDWDVKYVPKLSIHLAESESSGYEPQDTGVALSEPYYPAPALLGEDAGQLILHRGV